MANFLALPAELRLRIYYHVFRDTFLTVDAGLRPGPPRTTVTTSKAPAKAADILSSPSPPPPTKDTTFSLFRVSRLISREAQPIFWTHTTLELCYLTLPHFATISLPPKWLEQITSLIITQHLLIHMMPSALNCDDLDFEGQFDGAECFNASLATMLGASEAPRSALRRIRVVIVFDDFTMPGITMWNLSKVREHLPTQIEVFEIDLTMEVEAHMQLFKDAAHEMREAFKVVLLDEDKERNRLLFSMDVIEGQKLSFSDVMKIQKISAW